MDIGQFKHRITLVKELNCYDESGFEQVIYEDYITLWAYINNLKGSEFWTAKQLGYENTLEVVVRYNKKLENINTKTFYIKYKQKLYDITYIDNIKHNNTYIKFKVTERG